MRTILIVFAILLVLLTLLGTFGGSIKYREPFYELSTLAEQEQRHQIDQEHFRRFAAQEHPAKLRFEDDMPPPQDGGMVDVANSLPLDDQPPIESFYDAIPPTPSDIKKAKFLDMPSAPKMPVSQPHPPAQFEPSMEGFMIEPFEEDSKSSFPAAY